MDSTQTHYFRYIHNSMNMLSLKKKWSSPSAVQCHAGACWFVGGRAWDGHGTDRVIRWAWIQVVTSIMCSNHTQWSISTMYAFSGSLGHLSDMLWHSQFSKLVIHQASMTFFPQFTIDAPHVCDYVLLAYQFQHCFTLHLSCWDNFYSNTATLCLTYFGPW